MLYPLFTHQLNRAFKQQYHLGPYLDALDNQVIWVECQRPSVSIYLSFIAREVSISSTAPQKAIDAHIQAPLKAYKTFLTTRSATQAQRQGLHLNGNLETIQQLQQLFLKFDRDGEEWLSQWIGDYPAHLFSRAGHQAYAWLKDSKSRLKDLLKCYIEEKGLFPSDEEAILLYNDIDELSLDVERAEARIHRLIMSKSE